MRKTATLLKYCGVVLLLSSGLVNGAPQNGGSKSEVTASDIANTNKRYGQDSGNVDSTLVEELFGSSASSVAKPSETKKENPEYGVPAGIVDDDKYDNCTYYAEDGYKCVPYYQCKGGYIITDAEGLFDIRGAFDYVELDPESSKCESYLEVCCRSEDYFGLPPPTRAPKTTTTTEKPTPAPYVHKCGRRNKGGIGVRIQNEGIGNTQFGEWPHMCAVLNKTTIGGNDVNLYVCGASLIAPGIVLTGAHCVNKLDTENIKVRCGEWDTQQNIEPVEHEDRYAKYVTLHPNFKPRNLQNDFALIHLESDFFISPHIDTICLPDQFDPNPYLERDCVATGWGKDKFGAEGVYQVILKQVEMDLVPSYEERDGCQTRLRTTRVGGDFRLDSSFLCAGGIPGKDTCKGDGGGPLVCPRYPGAPYEDQQYYQAGITAWGIGCGTNIPGVYANVKEGLCFIDWATKCEDGEYADYYGYTGCRRWAKREYCNAIKTKEDIEYKLSLVPKGPFETKEDRKAAKNSQKGLRSELRRIFESIENYKRGVTACKTGPKDLDCDYYDYFEDSDDIPIASNARKGPTGGGKNTRPKSNDDDDDNDNHDGNNDDNDGNHEEDNDDNADDHDNHEEDDDDNYDEDEVTDPRSTDIDRK